MYNYGTDHDADHGGILVAKVLKHHGVEYAQLQHLPPYIYSHKPTLHRFLFTLCGGHISPILVGAKALGIRVIDVHHNYAHQSRKIVYLTFF